MLEGVRLMDGLDDRWFSSNAMTARQSKQCVGAGQHDLGRNCVWRDEDVIARTIPKQMLGVEVAQCFEFGAFRWAKNADFGLRLDRHRKLEKVVTI